MQPSPSRVKPADRRIDLKAEKARQRGARSFGDYAIVGTTLQIVGEQLCEAFDLRAGQKVLDVAAGNGNITLAAARRWCQVASTDYVPSLLERGRARAAAEGLTIEFKEADAEALTFAEATFDVVVSTFGVMFTPKEDKAAAKLLRVCKNVGKIGLANWTPTVFIGQSSLIARSIRSLPLARAMHRSMPSRFCGARRLVNKRPFASAPDDEDGGDQKCATTTQKRRYSREIEAPR